MSVRAARPTLDVLLWAVKSFFYYYHAHRRQDRNRIPLVLRGRREGGRREPNTRPCSPRRPTSSWKHLTPHWACSVGTREEQRVKGRSWVQTVNSSLFFAPLLWKLARKPTFLFYPQTVTSNDRRPPSRLRAKIWIRPHLVLIMFTLWNFNTSLMFQVLFFCVITQNDVREANLSSTNARAQKTAFPRTATWIREMH